MHMSTPSRLEYGGVWTCETLSMAETAGRSAVGDGPQGQLRSFHRGSDWRRTRLGIETDRSAGMQRQSALAPKASARRRTTAHCKRTGTSKACTGRAQSTSLAEDSYAVNRRMTQTASTRRLARMRIPRTFKSTAWRATQDNFSVGPWDGFL
jgi:hypothetical protein